MIAGIKVKPSLWCKIVLDKRPFNLYTYDRHKKLHLIYNIINLLFLVILYLN